MKDEEILELLKTDGALFNARYYKDAECAAAHINKHHGKVTVAQVKKVMDPLAIHAGTGEILPPM
jgi:hypothetical protein